MDISRRSFIKWVIAGAASASPFGCAPSGKSGGKNIPEAQLGSETEDFTGGRDNQRTLRAEGRGARLQSTAREGKA